MDKVVDNALLIWMPPRIIDGFKVLPLIEADALFQAQVKGSRRRLNLEEASTGAWWHASMAPKGLVDDSNTFRSLSDLLSLLAS